MMNIPFKEIDKEKNSKMTKLYHQIFTILLSHGEPMLSTIIYMNENFEKIYHSVSSDIEVYEIIFNNFGIKYSINKSKDKD